MPQYRIEVSPNNRAGCKDTVCKANQAKILKGELRFGTWVEISEHGSWGWKHWGCVSGSQMMNLQDACKQDDGGYDFDAIDGYDELEDHSEVQEKIRRCVKQGHVDAADFKGDPEKNKPGEKGIRLTAKQKTVAEAEAHANASSHDDPVRKKATKRNRKDDIESSDEEPAPKRIKTSKAAKASDIDEEELPARKTKKSHDASVRKSKASSAVKAVQDEEVAKKGLTPAEASRKRAALKKKESGVSGAQHRDHAEEGRDDHIQAVTAKKPQKSSLGAAEKSSMNSSSRAQPKADNGGASSSRKVRRSTASEQAVPAASQPTRKTSSKRELKGKAAAVQPVADEQAGQRRRGRPRKA